MTVDIALGFAFVVLSATAVQPRLTLAVELLLA